MARGYRFGVVGNLSTVPDGSTVTPTDDITIWLKCGRRSETYTTLSQVLSDSTCLGALIADNNAVNYMVRSTTWASGVTADSGAMTLIGANNYASNTLLDDSTWLNAICNSTYFESVLNAKVPVMTSNTTPSGKVTYLRRSGTSTDGYKAFDGNDSSYAGGSGTSNWIAYTFTENLKVYVVDVIPYLNNTFYIDGSNNHVDYQDIGDFTTLSENNTGTNNTKSTVYINPSIAYKTYRVNFSGGSGLGIYTIQFYGRIDV